LRARSRRSWDALGAAALGGLRREAFPQEVRHELDGEKHERHRRDEHAVAMRGVRPERAHGIEREARVRPLLQRRKPTIKNGGDAAELGDTEKFHEVNRIAQTGDGCRHARRFDQIRERAPGLQRRKEQRHDPVRDAKVLRGHGMLAFDAPNGVRRVDPTDPPKHESCPRRRRSSADSNPAQSPSWKRSGAFDPTSRKRRAVLTHAEGRLLSGRRRWPHRSPRRGVTRRLLCTTGRCRALPVCRVSVDRPDAKLANDP
jgi:hypothetical protein